jgi:hypothetical protein
MELLESTARPFIPSRCPAAELVNGSTERRVLAFSTVLKEKLIQYHKICAYAVCEPFQD